MRRDVTIRAANPLPVDERIVDERIVDERIVDERIVDERIVADPTMPHLSIALDPLFMQMHFQSLLFGSFGDGDSATATPLPHQRHEVIGCEVMRVKYRAGEKCVISYRLQIRSDQYDHVVEQWLCARIFPTGSAASRFQKALREPLMPPLFGKPVMFLPELEMVLWAFPNDRKIAGLPALMAAAAREDDQLDQIVAATWGNTVAIAAHHTKLIHYVPEHTCTVRVQLALTGAPSMPPPDEVTLFGKAYYNDEGAETYRLMTELWHSEACRKGQLRIARPLAYNPALRLLWQAGLTGRTLLTYPLGTALFDDYLVAAARSVALLHSAALPCRRQSTLQEWTDLIGARRKAVIASCPHLADAIGTLTVSLRCFAPNAADEPLATLHGDLHLQNFFVDEAAPVGEQIALIDLDNLSNGSPWRDLGSFCAGLYYRALVDGVAEATIARSIKCFLQAYTAHVAWPLDWQAVNWYTAAALLNERAFRAISRLKEGRLAMVDDFVRIATNLLLTR